ncbi:hypothetical protein JL722_6756 [Aureococcus anophagefferens]|nr:hypothetical protein JL722_6756 [Aureococcus anophagefferens]
MPQPLRETPKSCLAKYLIVGARKGGTTSLYQWLSAHPRAVGYGLDLGAEAGELQFFNHDGFFAGETPLDRDSYLPTPKRRLDAAEDAAREERDDRAANATNATHAPKKKKGRRSRRRRRTDGEAARRALRRRPGVSTRWRPRARPRSAAAGRA